jgi:hypothetical protein
MAQAGDGIELDTPTIAREMPDKINAGRGEASQARHNLVSPSIVVRSANRGLGYEPSESSPTSKRHARHGALSRSTRAGLGKLFHSVPAGSPSVMDATFRLCWHGE